MTNKTVRPIMTVEARDAINRVHLKLNTISEKERSRSEAIVSILGGWDEVGSEIAYLNAVIAKRDEDIDNLTREVEYMKNNPQQWKLIAWSMTAACVALVATMMITAS